MLNILRSKHQCTRYTHHYISCIYWLEILNMDSNLFRNLLHISLENLDEIIWRILSTFSLYNGYSWWVRGSDK